MGILCSLPLDDEKEHEKHEGDEVSDDDEND